METFFWNHKRERVGEGLKVLSLPHLCADARDPEEKTWAAKFRTGTIETGEFQEGIYELQKCRSTPRWKIHPAISDSVRHVGSVTSSVSVGLASPAW